MKHKHADVLIAIAEGKDVEYKLPNIKDWILASVNDSTKNPINYDNLEWRVKKEPVIEVKLYQAHSGVYYHFAPDLEHWDLKITYQDGKAIKAELPA